MPSLRGRVTRTSACSRANEPGYPEMGTARLIFLTLQIPLHSQPTLGLACDFWLLCQSSYLLFVWVVNAITFEHIASNPFCLLAKIPRFRCGVLGFSVMFSLEPHGCTI